MSTKNYHALEVKFVSPTNEHLEPKVKIISKRFEKSKIIPFDGNFGNTYDIAENYLIQRGFNIIGLAEFGDSYLIITDTFESL